MVQHAFTVIRDDPKGQPAPVSSEPVLDVVCLAGIAPKPVEWLWPNWIAAGKVSALAGEGGQGKSTIICDITARITRAEVWPDGGAAISEPGNVIILSSEDDLSDTLVPRLMAAGADLERVHVVQSVTVGEGARRAFSLQADLARLEAKAEEIGNVRMIGIDPVTSYLGKVDSHKNAEVRSVLDPLNEMASRTRTAILCNNHFSKGGGSANSRVIGSVAFVNAARASFIVTPDPENESQLFLIPSKKNVGPMMAGIAYTIAGHVVDFDGMEIPTSRISWSPTPVTVTADQALAAFAEGEEARTGKADAIEFLEDYLAKGRQLVDEIKQASRKAGITDKSLRSAKKELRVVSKRDGFGPGAEYYWVKP